MTTADYRKKRDEILMNLSADAANSRGTATFDGDFESATRAIDTLFLELIGEDQKVVGEWLDLENTFKTAKIAME